MAPPPPPPPRGVRERALVFLAPVVLLFFRVVPLLFLAAAPVFAVDRDFVDAERFAVERLAFGLAADERADVLRPVLFAPPAPEVESSGHLPDITRSAASATASAISDPKRVALVITEFAAELAVSAASIPASLIAFRAFGLALIAAAAAASPAASISLLIAALAILSTVVLLDFDLAVDFDDFDDPLRVLDFAIAEPPFGRSNRHTKRTTVPLRPRKGGGFRPNRQVERERKEAS